MADYYTKLSFVFNLDEERNQTALDLLALPHLDIDEQNTDDDGEPAGITLEKTNEGIWVHADEAPNIKLLAERLQQLLKNDEKIGFAWAFDCSKPCLDAYGGGAVVITKNQIYWCNTFDFLNGHLK